MANQKIIEGKARIVEEIKEKVQNAKSVVFFEYRGLTVSETDKLRKILWIVLVWNSLLQA